MKVLSLLFIIFAANIAQAECLSHRQIMGELRRFAASQGQVNISRINEYSSILLISSFPVASWQDISNIPSFRSCGVVMGPNDLRPLQTVGELADAIEEKAN